MTAETATLSPVEPGYRQVLRVRALVFWLPLLIAAIVADLVFLLPTPFYGLPSIGMVFLAATAILVVPSRRYQRLGYALHPTLLQVVRGAQVLDALPEGHAGVLCGEGWATVGCRSGQGVGHAAPSSWRMASTMRSCRSRCASSSGVGQGCAWCQWTFCHAQFTVMRSVSPQTTVAGTPQRVRLM